MAQVARIDFESLERPFITVNMAGNEKRLPITFNEQDLSLMKQSADAMDGMISFFAKYLGEEIRDAGDDQLKMLSDLFIEQRAAIGAPTLGE